MRCSNCGHEIPNNTLYCKYCGEEIRIVPDYNPLDDMLTAQIKLSINDDKDKQLTKTGRTQAQTNTQPRRTYEEREARRRQAERRREIKRKKRRRLLIAMSFVFLLLIGLGILLYQTSYTGIVKKGNRALLSSEYANAQEYFEKAIQKKPELKEAYVGLSKVYIAKSNITDAEKVFLNAIKKHPENASLYEACIEYYLDINEPLEIPVLLSKATDKVRDTLSDYIVSKPEYSLDSETVYDDVQQLSLTSKYETIYYTLDGTDPTFQSTKYAEPIQLDEGETIVKAFAVNENGIPGLFEEKVYVIELPIEDAPAVSPSTGQYEQNMKIEIIVPEGYTAYYTMDGSTPTTASTKYTGPINMPENDTLFKAILVNASGRSSGVTTRNYILDIPEEEE